MKSKQTSYSSKEILCFCVRKHDQRASIMRKCALIIVVLMISKNVSAQVLDETTTKFSTGITYSDIPEEASTTSEVILEKENDSTSDSFSIFKFYLTPSSNLKNDVASEASKAEIRNIKINPVYNATRNKILLNVSWDQPSEWEDTIRFYQFKIAANSSYVECFERDNSFEIIQKNMTSSSICLPPYHHFYDIKVGCTYKVSILAYSSIRHWRKDVIYTVPECIATKCSCQYRTPQVKNLKVLQISPSKFNISWGIQNNSINNRLNISQVIFTYRPFIPNSDMRFSVPHLLANFSYEKDYFIFNDTHQILAFGKTYQLLATFRTIYNCKGKTHTNFTVNAGNIPEDINETNNTTKSSGRSNNSLEIALLVILLSFAFVTVIYLLRRNRLVLKELVLNPFALRFTRHGRHRQDLRNTYIMVPTITKRQQEINMLYVDKEIIDGNVDHYEFPRTRIELLKEIGEGAFGQVFKAKAFGIRDQPGYTYVAVKKLREGAPPDEMDDFLSEIEILKKVGEHPNIISMFGCCVIKEPYLMVMEFVPCGDLKRYLLDLREKWIKKKRSRNDSTPVFSDSSDGAYVSPDSPRSRLTSEDRPSVTETEYTTLGSDGLPTPTELYNDKIECTLDHTELQNFALQIARGMEHLEKIPIAHRDLAARNILINEFKTLKISDFGLSRIGPYVNIKKKKLPLRWMSIESIEDHFYDSKSDVWSFAVVLWEIGTLGAFPYENVHDAVVPYYLASGNRLPRPEICTDELYSLMLKCWSHEPQLRPSFQELVELLDVKRRRIYVDFNQLNPLYVFPPSELPEHDKNLNSPA